MPHIADHQFMALFELATLNGPGQKIADRSQKRNLLGSKSSFFGGADTKDAVGATVAAGDATRYASLAIVVLQIIWHLESRFGIEILDDDRSCRVQGGARKTVGRGRGQDRADQIGFPTIAGAQQ